MFINAFLVLSSFTNSLSVYHLYTDDKVNEVMKRYETKANETALTETVGRTKVFLEADVKCRSGECNFGNLAADAFVYAVSYSYLDNLLEASTFISFNMNIYKLFLIRCFPLVRNPVGVF